METVSLRIERLVYGGDGLGFVSGMPVFVPMTVPGDLIECGLVKRSRGFATGRLLRVIERSPNRVLPKCGHFGRCGGCQWQHIDYASQLLWKQLILEEQLIRIGKIKEPNVLPSIPSPKIWNYRSRIKLHKGADGGLGFYAMGTHDLIEIKECLIADTDAVRRVPEFFTQVNIEQNENLKTEIAGIVKALAPRNVLELYCGSGNLTFPLCGLVEEITAGDSDRDAVSYAEKLALKKKVANVRFICQPAKAVMNHAAKNMKGLELLIVDPPRNGCMEIIEGTLRLRPEHIIYVSCNPSTLARDVGSLVKGRYELVSSQPIDMFPQTFHIESINLLSVRTKNPPLS